MPLIRCGGSDSGSGSTIKVVTGDDGLYGKTLTLSDGVDTLTGQFSNSGECTFRNVEMIGTLTLSASVSGVTVTETISMPYYGTLEVAFGRDMKTINISTDETTLVGKTVTVTYDTSKTKTATIANNGTATVVLYGYTGAATVTATDGTDTAEAAITIGSADTYSVELAFAQIYGATWAGGSSTAWTRTDAAANFADPSPAVNNGNGSSPFDDISPWKDMVIVDDATGGKLVKIPKYYYKWTKTGTSMKLQVSMKNFDGAHVSPAHADRGDGKGERDVVYVGRYHCASTYKSTSGVKPKASATRSAFRSSIHNLGAEYWQYDFAMYWTIMMLYLVEFADWNSQKVIGYGCGNNSGTENMGSTDGMTYHTGTTKSNRTTYGHTQYRHIEDLWGNVLDWCDGIRFSSSDVYIINKPADFSDSAGGTKVGTRPTSSNYISAWNVPTASGLEWALYPSAVSGGEQTYVGDYCYCNSSGVVLFVGGGYGQDQSRGAFFLDGDYSASGSDSNVGSRLQKLPA